MDTYVEIVCQVVDAGSVKMYSCVNMGDDMGTPMPSLGPRRHIR